MPAAVERAGSAGFPMEYDDCVKCGFKCSSICTVARGTRKHDLHEFLERYLGNGEAVAWPCTGCHACDEVCLGERKPYQLIQTAMRDFLKGHENVLSDYHAEFIDHGRIGASGVFLDNLVLPARAAGEIPILLSFDKVVVFPGCLVSARFPWLVYRLYQLLVLLGVDQKRIIVDDEACCGSFLQLIDEDEYMSNGEQLFKGLTKKEKVLVITACGSCTSTLQDLQQRLITEGASKKVVGSPGSATILHYTELLALPGSIAVLKPLAEQRVAAKAGNGKKRIYFQFPCQANHSLSARKRITEALNVLLKAAGYKTTGANRDLGCCGAGLLDTHPDLAIEYGVHRMTNITVDSEAEVGTIAVACGNCHRIFVDFKPSLQVECDRIDGMDVDVRFLLDMLMEVLVP